MAFMVGLEARLFHKNSNMTTTSHLHRPSLFPLPNSISLPHIATSQISLRRLKLKTPKSKVYAASTPVLPITPTPSTPLFNSTRSVSSIIALALSISKLFATAIQGIPLKLQQFGMIPTPDELASIQSLKQNLVCTTGPLFFAAMRGTRLNTPLTVVAAGMAKWLEIYGGLLMVRVLLSWFPNIPWDRQPLSAIRDLCDPYLNLFRNIIPPVFNTLDVSPLLAFAVMGVMGSILSNSTLA